MTWFFGKQIMAEFADQLLDGLLSPSFHSFLKGTNNGSEFVNDKLINYCLGEGIELSRSRPYRKNDQAWIEQKNGCRQQDRHQSLISLTPSRDFGGAA
jgi:hypothetical protein